MNKTLNCELGHFIQHNRNCNGDQSEQKSYDAMLGNYIYTNIQRHYKLEGQKINGSVRKAQAL